MSSGIAEGTIPLQKVRLRLDALPGIIVTRHGEARMVLVTAVIRLYFRTQPLDEDFLVTKLRETYSLKIAWRRFVRSRDSER